MDLYMGETLLRDSDVMGMAHGLEIRLPFLDADFVDYSLTLESEVRVPKPFPKHLFVRAVKDWLPEENVTRSKQGFTLPFHEWMLHELKGAVWEGLESLVSLNTVFDKKVIRTLWETFSRNPDRIGWARPWSLFVLGRYLATHRLEV
jgi:asparagine synthase (glutamine-hydrolysing)